MKNEGLFIEEKHIVEKNINLLMITSVLLLIKGKDTSDQITVETVESDGSKIKKGSLNCPFFLIIDFIYYFSNGFFQYLLENYSKPLTR